MHYILADDGATPLPVPVLTWAHWLEHADRIVARTPIGQPPTAYVSTVFVGIDMGYGDSPPLLWETMAFPANPDSIDFHDTHCQRYPSRADAEAGHANLVRQLSSVTPP